MDRAHQTLYDTKLVVNDFCEGRQAVGRAGRIGDLTSDGVRDSIYAVNQYLPQCISDRTRQD